MSRTFLIFALPRSATAWLSCFLTYGRSHCAHELSREKLSVRGVVDAMRAMRGECVGNSDSGMLLFHGDMAKALPDATFIYVNRRPEECAQSLERVTEVADGYLRTSMRMLSSLLHRAHRERPGIWIRFEDLFEEATARELWAVCVGTEFPLAHWRKMKTLRVVQDPEIIREAQNARRQNVVSAHLCSSIES